MNLVLVLWLLFLEFRKGGEKKKIFCIKVLKKYSIIQHTLNTGIIWKYILKYTNIHKYFKNMDSICLLNTFIQGINNFLFFINKIPKIIAGRQSSCVV